MKNVSTVYHEGLQFVFTKPTDALFELFAGEASGFQGQECFK